MTSLAPRARAISDNSVYDRLWARLPLFSHEGWPTWGALSAALEAGGRALELGCGVLPRLPVRPGSYFANLSLVALRRLGQAGGTPVRVAGPLPFADGAFAVVCAFEVLEHIPDDEAALADIARVLRPGGTLLFSVPVNPAYFTHFDAVCGHVRRYDAAALAARLHARGLVIERWATQPNRFGPIAGALAGWITRLASAWPGLMIWLKRKSAENQRLRPLHWRTDPIEHSHQEGGLIAIARRGG